MSSSYDQGLLALPLFTDGHRELAGRVAAWCDDHRDLCGPSTDDDPDKRGRALLDALGTAGLLTLDADLRSVCVVREGLAYAGDLADFAYSIQCLSATPIVRHGTREQQDRYLPAMARGTVQGAFAISEEEAGSDVAAMQTSARRDGDSYVLDGTKTWIANATSADLFVVVARTGEGPGALGLTAFCVPADTPGVRVRPVPMIAPRAFGDVVLDGVRVPADAVLGRPGGGFAIAIDLLDRFRMTVGAAAIGFARRAADAALGRARTRKIYGGRLFDLPTVKATLADIAVKLEAASLLVARAAWEADTGNRKYARHSAAAKLYATEAAQEIVDACVQLYGAAGLVQDSVTERLYRQVRSLRVYEGASEVQKTIIAGALDLRRSEVAHIQE